MMFIRFVRVNLTIGKHLPLLRPLQARCMSNDGSDPQWKDVLDYWFSPGAEQKWFGGGEQVDNEIRTKFGKMVELAHQGGLEDWELEPKPSLALIVLTDQFSRSIFRGSPRSFDGDERARKITRKFLERGTHDHLKQSFAERGFIYLPMEHSEDPIDQKLSVALCEEMAKDAVGTDSAERAKDIWKFAKLHKEVIDKFGRYPQRNKALGRENTAAEEDFLQNTPDRYSW